MTTSILDATKIQSRIVIPIVKALEKELGKERAHEIVGRAIAESYVAYRERLGFEPNEPSRRIYFHGARFDPAFFPDFGCRFSSSTCNAVKKSALDSGSKNRFW